MPSPIEEPAPHPVPRFGVVSVGAHAAFYVLVLMSAVRYVLAHGADAGMPAVAALSIVLVLLYTALLLVPDRAVLLGRAGVVGLVVVWGALVAVAPSFAWCAFPIFFACRAAFARRAAALLVGVVAALASLGLFRLSGGGDVAALVGPVAVAVLLWLVYDGVEREAGARVRLEREMAAAHSRLAESRREAAVLAERERLARELHDTVTQDLASTLLHLEAADAAWGGPGTRDAVRGAMAAIRTDLARTRRLVHDLATPPADGADLPEAILAAARRQVPAATLTVTGAVRDVPGEVSHALVRVVQSGAANVRQHAGAERFGLTLGYLPDAVTLDLFDDGRGFDPDAVAEPSDSGGYGLRAMRQRLVRLGGTVTVESRPGEGTIVAAQIPLGPAWSSDPGALPAETSSGVGA